MTFKKKKKRDYQHEPLDLSDSEFPMEINGNTPDVWQQEVLDYWGNIAIRSGRQVGKSAIMAKKAAMAALKWKGIKILVSASSERQAAYLYEKIKFELKFMIEDVFADTPTMRRILLKNASEIYCLPTGQTGDLIRGLTLDIWIPDEAAYIREAVYATCSPMLWISKKERNMGWIWALSTPNGKQGMFYNFFNNKDFKTWHIKSTDCERIPKEELELWKKTYTKVQYTQEVLGEFIDEVSRLFPENLLKSCFKDEVNYNIKDNLYLGVDVARYGGDENAFVVVAERNDEYRVVYSSTTERKGINETFQKIIELNNQFKFRKILVDDAGVGGGLTDFLIEKYRNKVIGINNAQRAIASDGKKKKQIMKHDLYSNAIMLMEAGKVEIKEDENMYLSLASIQFEYNLGKPTIFGRYSHLAEAYTRAIWGAKKKGLKLFLA